MNIVLSVLKWIPLNIASLFGIIQALIKCVKEIVTALLNLIVCLITLLPSVKFEKANNIVLWARSAVEAVDAFVEKWKVVILGWVK